MKWRQRIRIAWELTWPLALIDAAVVVLLHGMLDVQGETWDSVWAFASFLGVAPFVVRRALRLKYGSLRIEPVLTYQQSLKVMWLLMWRTLVLSIAALLAVSLILRAIGVGAHAFEEQSPLVNNLGLSVADAVSSLVFSPLLIPAMLRKKYRGFRLEIVEDAPPAKRHGPNQKL